MRTCQRCHSADISHEAYQRRYCRPCSAAAKRQASTEHMRRVRNSVPLEVLNANRRQSVGEREKDKARRWCNRNGVQLMLPTEPLAEVLQGRLALETRDEIAAAYATRWGLASPISPKRFIERVLLGEQHLVHLDIADRWAITLGRHLDNIWVAA